MRLFCDAEKGEYCIWKTCVFGIKHGIVRPFAFYSGFFRRNKTWCQIFDLLCSKVCPRSPPLEIEI